MYIKIPLLLVNQHCFNKVDVPVLSALAAGVVRVAPHDDVTDL